MAAPRTGNNEDITDIEDLAERLAQRDFDPCDCCRCSSLCHGVPGLYDPAHLERLLAEGETTLAALVASCVLDYWMAENDEPIFYIRPRVLAEGGGEGGGRVAPPAPILGRCVHLGPNGCTLQRTRMPIECVSTYACRRDGGIGKSRAVELWGNDAGRDLVRRFEAEATRLEPGRPPAIQEYVVGLMGVMAMGPMGPLLMQLGTAEVDVRRERAARALHAVRLARDPDHGDDVGRD